MTNEKGLKDSLVDQIKAANCREVEDPTSIEENKAKKLYEVAVGLDPSTLLRLVQRSNSDEERKFFAQIADMNLQRVQKQVIEEKLF